MQSLIYDTKSSVLKMEQKGNNFVFHLFHFPFILKWNSWNIFLAVIIFNYKCKTDISYIIMVRISCRSSSLQRLLQYFLRHHIAENSHHLIIFSVSNRLISHIIYFLIKNFLFIKVERVENGKDNFVSFSIPISFAIHIADVFFLKMYSF